MSAIIAVILGNKFILMLIAGVVAVAGAWWKGRSGGIKRERAKQAEATAKARVTRNKVEGATAKRPGTKNRKRLGKWAK